MKAEYNQKELISTTKASKLASVAKNEIASAARDYLHPMFMGLLGNNDDTLATRGMGKGLAIYDDIERDAFAFAVINKRKMAVVSFPWEVDPASTSLKDRKAAELVKTQLTAINFDKLTLDLLDANLKGFAICEVIWATDGSHIYIEKVIPRNQRRFVFDEYYQPRMLTTSDMLKGEQLPERKFVVHSIGAKDGSPYGLGLGSKLFWPTFFKRQNITFWLTFADKFGSPTTVGKYPSGTIDSEQDKLLAAVSSVAQEAGIIMPDDMKVELLEASRSGAGDFYERMCRYMDEQISVAVLGETMTTIAKAAGLGSGQSDVQNDIRLELARADADLLTGSIQQSLVKWIVELNMPGAGIPRVWRKIEAQEDLKARAERDVKIKGLGFKPTLEYITDTYGEGWELDAAPSPLAPIPKGEGDKNNASFAEHDQVTQNQITREDQLSTEAAPAWNKMLDSVKAIVDKATSLEGLRDDLLASFAELNMEDLAKVMAVAFAAAELAGMDDVNSGS